MHTQINKNSKGFSGLLLVLALLIVGAIGLAGYYALHKNNSTTKGVIATTKKTSPTTPKHTTTAATTAPADPSEGGKYLVIKEWGVRFPVPESEQGDLYYVIQKNVNLNDSDQGGAIYGDVAYFSSHRISSHANNTCTPVVDAQGTVTSGAGPEAITRSSTRPLPNSDLDKQLSNMWYTPSKSNGGVCYEGSTGTEESALATAVVQGVAQLELSN